MQIKVYVIDLKPPRWFKRVIAVSVLAVGIGMSAGVSADVILPHSFTGGEKLTSKDLNDDFEAVVDGVNSATPAGTILAFAGEKTPAGWLPCDGTMLDGTNPKWRIRHPRGSDWHARGPSA